MTTFEAIKKLAKEKHMSLSELNNKAGLGTNTIYSWKTSSPSLENIAKVAKVLMVSTNDLLNIDDESVTSDDKTFDRIKKLAKRRGMSLEQVNDKSGLGKRSIYHWRDRSSPSMDNLDKVAKVLHTSTDYLLGNTENPDPASKDNPAIDIENDKLLAYRGRPIPDDYLDIIKNLMDSDIERGKRRG